MKTLNTKALAIALLLSSASVFAVGASKAEQPTTEQTQTTDAPATSAQAADDKKSDDSKAFFARMREKFSNGWTAVQAKTQAGYDAVKDKAAEHPRASKVIGAAAVTSAVAGTGYLVYNLATGQSKVKANLLKALEEKAFNKVEIAFNKLNKANKAAAQKTFDAYKKAVKSAKNVRGRSAQRRSDAQLKMHVLL